MSSNTQVRQARKTDETSWHVKYHAHHVIFKTLKNTYNLCRLYEFQWTSSASQMGKSKKSTRNGSWWHPRQPYWSPGGRNCTKNLLRENVIQKTVGFGKKTALSTKSHQFFQAENQEDWVLRPFTSWGLWFSSGLWWVSTEYRNREFWLNKVKFAASPNAPNAPNTHVTSIDFGLSGWTKPKDTSETKAETPCIQRYMCRAYNIRYVYMYDIWYIALISYYDVHVWGALCFLIRPTPWDRGITKACHAGKTTQNASKSHHLGAKGDRLCPELTFFCSRVLWTAQP